MGTYRAFTMQVFSVNDLASFFPIGSECLLPRKCWVRPVHRGRPDSHFGKPTGTSFSREGWPVIHEVEMRLTVATPAIRFAGSAILWQ